MHAPCFDEPVELAATRSTLYVADYNAGLVRRVDASQRVSTLARLAQVTAVAVSPAGAVYAVTMTGTLARISAAGRITRIPVPGGLDRPHGLTFDRAGKLLVAEDSRRVRRVDPATGRAELVVDGVDANRIAVTRDGTCSSPAAARQAAASAGSSRAGSRRSCSRASTSATSPCYQTVIWSQPPSSPEPSIASMPAPAPGRSSPPRTREAASRRPL